MAVLRRRIGGASDSRCDVFAHGEDRRCLGEMRYSTFADHAEAFLGALGYPYPQEPAARSTS